MSWKIKALLIWGLAVPAFTGLPMEFFPGSLPAGISTGWLLYAAVVYAAILLLLGRKIFRVSLLIALAISVPLVLLGTLVFLLGLMFGGFDPARLGATFGHYLRLLANMMVVIPLSLSMVAVLPLHRLEHHILMRRGGVRMVEKMALMFLRVFSHILYFVIPNILEVIREEGMLPGTGSAGGAKTGVKTPLSRRLKEIVQTLVNIGVESICSAVRYVPLWAEEISRLPGYTGADQVRKNDTENLRGKRSDDTE